jgi:ribosome biogenesis protein ENP2
MPDADAEAPAVGEVDDASKGVLTDPRFARLFEDEDFAVDERSHEFQAINPSTKIPKGLTAAEEEELDSNKGSSEDGTSESEAEEARPKKKKPAAPKEPVDKNRISSSNYRKAGHKSQRGPDMVVSSSKLRKAGPTRDKSFGSRVSKLKERAPNANRSTTTVVGEREITFAPEQKQRKRPEAEAGPRHDRTKQKDRRSASNNKFRGM